MSDRKVSSYAYSPTYPPKPGDAYRSAADGVAPKTLDCTYLPMTYAIGRDHAPCGFGEISDSDAFVYARAWLMRAFLAWDDDGKL